jgi:hypothetical protein
LRRRSFPQPAVDRRGLGGRRSVLNLIGGIVDRRLRSFVLGGAALAAIPLLLNLRDSAFFVIGHFHVSMQTAALVVTLVLEGSAWLMWVFPWIVPVEITVQILVAMFGIAYAVGW